jgi:hypothetical protein
MRRSAIWVGLAGAILILGAVPASAGNSSGNGAQKSALSPASNSGNASNCSQGSGSAADGSAVLNKTGKPVPGMSTIEGEVHVVDSALAGQTVMAFVVPSNSSNCMSSVMTTITLNHVGIGNGHLSGLEMNGSYYVTIMQGMNEVLASKAVPLL